MAVKEEDKKIQKKRQEEQGGDKPGENRGINILVCLGTRPEGIKMAPIIKALEKRSGEFSYKICSSGQHREMLKQVLDFFEYEPDYELNLMTGNQSLASFSSRLLDGIENILEEIKPDIVLIQGDTTTAFLIALSAYYKKIRVGHVEAGLRTYDKYSPFPEEINRQLITKVADLHFAPTGIAYDNLIRDGVSVRNIFLTGNTIIDAIKWGIAKIEKNSGNLDSRPPFCYLDSKEKMILVTMHRRESFGYELENICEALKETAENCQDVQIVYPVHLNPNVRGPVFKKLGKIRNIILTDPLEYESFIWLMNRSYLIVTDSGGVQEEAPTLKKPVLVIRKKTERMESVKLGISRLVGTDKDNIVKNISLVLRDSKVYNSMISKENPYGDGRASEKILDSIKEYFRSQRM